MSNTGFVADKKNGVLNGVRYSKLKQVDENGKITVQRISKQPCHQVGYGIYSYPEFYKKDGHNGQTRTWANAYKGTNKPKGNPVSQIQFVEMRPSKRYKCKACGTKFSVKLDPQQKHYRRDINEPFFLAIVNKGVLNRILDKYKTNPKTVYDKINFIHQQCLYFDKCHRYTLKQALGKRALTLSTDRQYYLSNWGDNDMPMPTRMVNTSTVDNDTGFVLAATVNFDFTSDHKFIKSENARLNDEEKEIYYRRYSQYILRADEIESPEEESTIDVPLQKPSKGLLIH
ncbi:MAG: hypothetical protein V7784_13320 [Oceanospirillaceae bacterium]